LGFLGRGANRLLSATGNGANTVFVGAGKGAGQVFGGVEGGLNAARLGILSGVQSGNAGAAIGGVSDGAGMAGRGVADGVTSVSVAFCTIVKQWWMATFGWFFVLARSHTNRKFQQNSTCWRWFAFVIANIILLSNVTMWLTFETIPSSIIISYYYGTGGAAVDDNGTDDKGSEGKAQESSISSLALGWLILYAPGTWFSWREHEKGGSRRCFLVGAMLTFVGAGVRYGSIMLVTPQFFVLELGQALAALGHPFLFNCIGRISADW
jgi:hypothetical protein